MTVTPTAPNLFDWQAKRDAALKQVAAGAGEPFMSRALRFVVEHLRANGECSGEDITDACWERGITAKDRRAMGPVYMALIRDGLIEKCGTCIRKRGNGTGGGSIYRIKIS